jgi:4-azaleucine resistance transporter AzlC
MVFSVGVMRSPHRTVHPDDLRDALALAAAAGLVGASFGALAASAGLSLMMTTALSLLVLAGGSQFLVVAVTAAGGGPLAAVAGGLLINARHLPYGLAVAPVLGDRPLARLAGAHLLIDEVVAFARARAPFGPVRARAAYWTCGVLLAAFWNLGTLAGALAGAAVPDTDVLGLDAAFPAALLALLLPALGRPDARRVGFTAAGLALLATPVLPPGSPVLVGLLGLAVAGRDRSGSARSPSGSGGELP